MLTLLALIFVGELANGLILFGFFILDVLLFHVLCAIFTTKKGNSNEEEL